MATGISESLESHLESGLDADSQGAASAGPAPESTLALVQAPEASAVSSSIALAQVVCVAPSIGASSEDV